MDLYCFDFHGSYLGRLADGGIFLDSRGRKLGRLAEGGDMYDVDGRYMGHINVQGSLFAADGSCRGYVRDWCARAGVARDLGRADEAAHKSCH